MKSLIFFLAFLFVVLPVSEVRKEYVYAVTSKESALKLHNELVSINKEGDKTLVAYKGAVLTLMAKFANSTKEKKTYFKEGATLLEYIISQYPNDIEMRYLRLGVQENSPKIVGYHKNKEEDKQFILENYSAIKSSEVKALIKKFILQSKSFSEIEKESIK